MIPLKDVNPTRRPAVLTIALIVACALVFAYQQTKPDDGTLGSRQGFICEYGLVADHALHGGDGPPVDGCEALNREHDRFLGLLSSLFLHADLLHLGFNMLFLWVFGNNIEERLGRIRFLPFFLLCGVLAGLAQALVDPDSLVPLIGASGAISGILGAYLVLYPRVRVWTVVLPSRLPSVQAARLALARDLLRAPAPLPRRLGHLGRRRRRLHGPHRRLRGRRAPHQALPARPRRDPPPSRRRRDGPGEHLPAAPRAAPRAGPKWVKVAFARHQPEAEMLARPARRAGHPGAGAPHDDGRAGHARRRAARAARPGRPRARGARAARPLAPSRPRSRRALDGRGWARTAGVRDDRRVSERARFGVGLSQAADPRERGARGLRGRARRPGRPARRPSS